MRKNGFIDTTSTIDGRLTAVASVPCMSTISPNSILHQQTQLLPTTKQYQHLSSATAYDSQKSSSSLHGTVAPNGTIGHNTTIGSNCHPSVNQTKSSLTMSQLSTVYATKRRRRNGKRYVDFDSLRVTFFTLLEHYNANDHPIFFFVCRHKIISAEKKSEGTIKIRIISAPSNHLAEVKLL